MSRPILVLFAILLPLAGCTGDLDGTALGSSAGPARPTTGETARYLVEAVADGAKIDVAYRWIGPGETRDGTGRALVALRVDVLFGAQTPEVRAAFLDPANGAVVTLGEWTDAYRHEAFAANTARWEAYPGLHRNASTGTDTLRALLLPALVLPARLAYGLEADIGGIRTMTEGAGGRYLVEHADAADRDASLRHALEYDDRSFFPARLSTTWVHDGQEERLWVLTRTEHEPGERTIEAPSGSAATALVRGGVARGVLGTLPPEGSARLPFPLDEAADTARSDARSAAFFARHSDALLVSGFYGRAGAPAALLPGTAARATWHLLFAAPRGEALDVIVERTFAVDGRRLADAVERSAPTRTPRFEHDAFERDVLTLGAALALATLEADIESEDPNLYVAWGLSLEERLQGSEGAATWQVGVRASATAGGVPLRQVTVSATTGATLFRDDFDPPQ